MRDVCNRQPAAAASVLCAPAIVRATSLMRVRGLILPIGGPRKRTTQEQEIIDWLAKGLWAINLALLQAHAIGYLDQEPAGFGLWT